MSNKKFISYFHMLYTELKGTAGAYMAALLVLLSAFAATGAEKTPTTDANRQALPMKAAVKKKSEITKKSPVDTKKTLASSSDLKVANIVILNNTGLPDSQIYFNLINTALVNKVDGSINQFCPPPSDWNDLFQSYGGTVSPATAAKRIQLNGVPPTLSYNAQKLDGSGYSSVTLAEMLGSVLSNATLNSPTPTSSNSYWTGAKYSDLVKNNPDSTHVGTFPTISMGLFGACNNNEVIAGLKLFAGRIVISAFSPFIGDKFINPQTPPVPPYVLIEGSIFPTDKPEPTKPLTPLCYPSQASNLDLSFVEQISIAANIELWAPESANGPFVTNPNGWLAGNSLTTKINTIELFQTYKPINGIGIQSVEYTPSNSNDKYDLFYAFTKNMTSPLSSFVSPYNQFLTNLITASGGTGNQVLKSAGTNINIGPSPVLEFGDCSYGYQLGYNFYTYFVDMSATTKTPWSKIMGWYATDSGTTLSSLSSVADPTQFLSYTNSNDPTQNITDYMLMLGTFSPSSGWSLSPCNLSACNVVTGGPGNGPLSIQLNANSIEICGVVNLGAGKLVHCGGTLDSIQSCGMNKSTDQMGGIFTTQTGTSTVNSPLGINFTVQGPSYLLQEFDLSVGKTITNPGTLEVDLVDVTSSTNLVKVSINIPETANEGLAASVVDDPNSTFPHQTSGFNPANANNGWPLQIDWQNLKCKYNGTLLSPTFYYWKTNQWVSIKTATQDYITACTLIENTHAYRLNINGTNLTVALTSLNPNGTAGTLITAGLTGATGATAVYTIGNLNYSEINSHGNGYLECQITISPAPTPATTLLHLLAVSKADLLAPTGLAGNSPKYRFLRWNTTNTTPIWEEAFGNGEDSGNGYWPLVTADSSNQRTGNCPSVPSSKTVATPQVAKNVPQTTLTLLNTISGRCLGDVCAAFTYGMVNSLKPASAFPASVIWPNSLPPQSTTIIGALTTAQYFQLLGSQTSNLGQLPAGANNRASNTILRYDPYNDLGVNQAQSNCYFSGFSDRFGSSGFGGIFNPNPTFLMDLTPAPPNKLSLGNVPGTITNNTVIVITLHPIPQHQQPPFDTDIDDDNDTDSEDLSLVLLAIGVCPPAPADCPEDVNNDGEVEYTDLGLVLLNLGTN